MKKNTKTTINIGLLIGLVAIIMLCSYVLPSSSMLFLILKKGAIYALIAVSMNLLNGFTGLFSLGQAGFMLIGAYTYAIFTIPTESRDLVYRYFAGGVIQFTLPVIVAIIFAGIIAAIFAFLIGLPVLRLKSDYLAIATLGFAEIIRSVLQWDKLGPITNGSNMLKNFPTFDSIVLGLNKYPFFDNLFASAPWLLTFLATMLPILIAGVCIAIIVLLINSSYGRAFKSIRDDEVAAEAMGINLARHKMMSFCTSAFFAGVGGALLAMFQSVAKAADFKSGMTYEILLIVVLGGIGSVTGSCIGSFLFIAASEWWLRFLDTETSLLPENKLTFVVIAALVVTALSAFVGFKSKDKEKKKKIMIYIMGGIIAMGILAWLVWFMLYGGLKLPFLRTGFRLVVFSIIIMCVVLFWRKGIMGEREFDVERIINSLKRLPQWFKNLWKKKGEVSGNE